MQHYHPPASVHVLAHRTRTFRPTMDGEIPMRSLVATSFLLATLTFSLGACGYSSGDRAASGGLIGAGGGAAIAAIAGGNPLVGAAIGSAAGAIGGAATNADSINLGRPVWR
jgi:hypothetical protein